MFASHAPKKPAVRPESRLSRLEEALQGLEAKLPAEKLAKLMKPTAAAAAESGGGGAAAAALATPIEIVALATPVETIAERVTTKAADIALVDASGSMNNEGRLESMARYLAVLGKTPAQVFGERGSKDHRNARISTAADLTGQFWFGGQPWAPGGHVTSCTWSNAIFEAGRKLVNGLSGDAKFRLIIFSDGGFDDGAQGFASTIGRMYRAGILDRLVDLVVIFPGRTSETIIRTVRDSMSSIARTLSGRHVTVRYLAAQGNVATETTHYELLRDGTAAVQLPQGLEQFGPVCWPAEEPPHKIAASLANSPDILTMIGRTLYTALETDPALLGMGVYAKAYALLRAATKKMCHPLGGDTSTLVTVDEGIIRPIVLLKERSAAARAAFSGMRDSSYGPSGPSPEHLLVACLSEQMVSFPDLTTAETSEIIRDGSYWKMLQKLPCLLEVAHSHPKTAGCSGFPIPIEERCGVETSLGVTPTYPEACFLALKSFFHGPGSSLSDDFTARLAIIIAGSAALKVPRAILKVVQAALFGGTPAENAARVKAWLGVTKVEAEPAEAAAAGGGGGAATETHFDLHTCWNSPRMTAILVAFLTLHTGKFGDDADLAAIRDYFATVRLLHRTNSAVLATKGPRVQRRTSGRHKPKVGDVVTMHGSQRTDIHDIRADPHAALPSLAWVSRMRVRGGVLMATIHYIDDYTTYRLEANKLTVIARPGSDAEREALCAVLKPEYMKLYNDADGNRLSAEALDDHAAGRANMKLLAELAAAECPLPQPESSKVVTLELSDSHVRRVLSAVDPLVPQFVGKTVPLDKAMELVRLIQDGLLLPLGTASTKKTAFRAFSDLAAPPAVLVHHQAFPEPVALNPGEVEAIVREYIERLFPEKATSEATLGDECDVCGELALDRTYGCDCQGAPLVTCALCRATQVEALCAALANCMPLHLRALLCPGCGKLGTLAGEFPNLADLARGHDRSREYRKCAACDEVFDCGEHVCGGADPATLATHCPECRSAEQAAAAAAAEASAASAAAALATGSCDGCGKVFADGGSCSHVVCCGGIAAALAAVAPAGTNLPYISNGYYGCMNHGMDASAVRSTLLHAGLTVEQTDEAMAELDKICDQVGGCPGCHPSEAFNSQGYCGGEGTFDRDDEGW